MRTLLTRLVERGQDLLDRLWDRLAVPPDDPLLTPGVNDTHTIHPRRAHIHALPTFGQRMADRVATVMGSWRYLIAQNVFIAIWMVINSVIAFSVRPDPYPFILLNLMMSWFAANSTPILQMSGNRGAARDRARDDTEASEVEQLWQINQQQMAYLTMLVHHLVEQADADETEEGVA